MKQSAVPNGAADLLVCALGRRYLVFRCLRLVSYGACLVFHCFHLDSYSACLVFRFPDTGTLGPEIYFRRLSSSLGNSNNFGLLSNSGWCFFLLLSASDWDRERALLGSRMSAPASLLFLPQGLRRFPRSESPWKNAQFRLRFRLSRLFRS